MQYRRRFSDLIIASGVRALDCLNKVEEKEEEQNRLLAGCRFATLTLIAGDVGHLIR